MSSDTRPNLLLIMTDQHRGDCLGCDGHPAVETPYLDQLAAEGTRFRCAQTAVPSCIPARATLMTGMDQWHTGVLGMGRSGGNMSTTYRHTLPGELAAAGYHTQGIGKMHFHPQRALYGFHNTLLDESSRERDRRFKSDYRRWFEAHKDGPYDYRDHSVGWNSWLSRPTHLPEHLHPTHWTIQQAVEWLDRRDPEKPFFLKVSFARPHSPYDPPAVYYDLYRDRPIPEPYVGDWAHVNDRRIDDVDAWRSHRKEEEIRRARACYYGNVTFIDHQIGRLLYELRKNHPEAWRNTFILFTADHGDMLGDHHLWRKGYAYQGASRIPMIVRAPLGWDWPRGQVLDHVVELRDVMPTFLEAAGVPIPDTVDGQSTGALARGETDAPWRPYLLGEHDWCFGPEQPNYYVTDGGWKYVWFPYLGSEQLFHLAEDPGECHDLSGDGRYADSLALWRGRLIHDLEARDCGLVRNGRLAPLREDQVVKSPHLGVYGCAPK
ncbi:MAG: arylsulfatase [Armatimonadetes bacterium]|nr:arylsulfatase [Armatimonadota bacterium]